MEKDIVDAINNILPEWALLKNIQKARAQGRIFDTKKDLTAYIESVEGEPKTYYCSNCEVYVVGITKHPNFMTKTAMMSGYGITNASRAFERMGLCEFCNHRAQRITR